jgi:hypothetical protein
MKMAMTVKTNDGQEKKIEAQFADFVAFERTWNRSVSNFSTELRLTDIAWLAWKSLTRTKATNMPFEPDWLNTVDTIEVVDEDDVATVPLEQAAQ